MEKRHDMELDTGIGVVDWSRILALGVHSTMHLCIGVRKIVDLKYVDIGLYVHVSWVQ